MANKNIPVNKNQDVMLDITALSSEGQGIGRVDGFAVFVPGALPGERVKAHIIKVTSGYAIGKLMEQETFAPERVRPVCPAYQFCGGCSLQHLSYEAQLKTKRQTVYDALQRLGGIPAPIVSDTLGMEEPWNYRNKGSFPIGNENGVAVFGFYSERSHRIAAVTGCPIHDERINAAVRHVVEWANQNKTSIYDEKSGRGLLRHVMARVTTGGEIMVVVVMASDRLPHKTELLETLADCDSVYLNVNPKNTNVIFGYGPDAFRLLQGKAYLTETILGLTFRVSPQSFLQVNPLQTAVLYGEAIRLLDAKPHETVIDGYCGVGTISLSIARNAGRVIGIETVKEAIDDARENAKDNGITNAEFLCGNVEDVLPRLTEKVHAVVIDPPRKGCEELVLKTICESEADRIVYVSCNPATLARDVKYLCANGFRLECATPVDMFPQTAHVETVVLLSRA